MPHRADRSTTPVDISLVTDGSVRTMPDQLATEEPLEIRLQAAGETRKLAVTMRTPGHDPELAAGFLYAEGVIESWSDIGRFVLVHTADGRPQENIIVVELVGEAMPDLAPLERHFYTTSACGVCGKAGLESLLTNRAPKIPEGPNVSADLLYSLPVKLRTTQGVFGATGGLHAAGIFDAGGNLLASREDIGRHNALDKVIGWAMSQKLLPLHEHIVMVSGRSSYEIVQKCIAAEVPFVCAVSAPSSLAVSMAREYGITLIGFLRDNRLNVYAGHERLIHDR
jgi:FdhD protein